MKLHKTWIVLVDSAHIRIAVNDGPGKGLYGLSADGLEAPQVMELSDEPGMTYARFGPNRGGISDPDLKGQAVAKYAGAIVKFLDAQKARDAFQHFILVAPPAMLGHLRQKLTSPLLAALRADIDKDLIHVPLQDLPAHLRDVIAV